MPNEVSNKPETSAIGDTRIQIKRSANGNLQAVKGTVVLSVAKNEIVEVKKRMLITAIGYDALNKVAGLSLVMPKRIEVPRYGAQPNPFFEVNPDTGAIRFVMAKMSAVGYSPIGSMCVVDQTLLFDLGAYFKMDAMAKIKYKHGTGKIANKQLLTEEERTYGHFMPILDENFGIWLDARHEEFMKLLTEHQQRQRFAERIALGILKRNCLRHHPSIAASVVIPQGGEAAVTVIGHRHELTDEQIRRLVDDDRDNDVETIAGVTHTDDIQSEEMGLSTQESAGLKEMSGTDVEVMEQENERRDKIMVRVEELKDLMGEDVYGKFYHEMVTSGRPLSEFDDDELERYKNLMEKGMDK